MSDVKDTERKRGQNDPDLERCNLGASGEELESKRGWLLYVTLDTGYLRCRCSFRGKRYVWGTRGEGVIVHA